SPAWCPPATWRCRRAARTPNKSAIPGRSRSAGCARCRRAAKLLRVRVEARAVGVERKRAAVAIFQRPALGLQVFEQLERERAREPNRVERIGAAHRVELRVERRNRDLAGPAAVALLLRAADLDAHRQALAVGAHAGHLELRHQVLHQGISVPSCEKNFPESAARRPPMTFRSPRTEASAESGALSPPMSVRTQPGLSATTTILRAASVAARPLTSMLSAALLVE